MESKINLLPVQQNLRNFKILESSHQIMIVASDKHREKFHIIRIDKKSDMDALNYNLEDLLKEEVMTFT